MASNFVENNGEIDQSGEYCDLFDCFGIGIGIQIPNSWPSFLF